MHLLSFLGRSLWSASQEKESLMAFLFIVIVRSYLFWTNNHLCFGERVMQRPWYVWVWVGAQYLKRSYLKIICKFLTTSLLYSEAARFVPLNLCILNLTFHAWFFSPPHSIRFWIGKTAATEFTILKNPPKKKSNKSNNNKKRQPNKNCVNFINKSKPTKINSDRKSRSVFVWYAQACAG